MQFNATTSLQIHKTAGLVNKTILAITKQKKRKKTKQPLIPL
jgi:hypothetical protein